MSYERSETDGRLIAFTITSEEYQRAISLVNGRSDSAPPIALQFEETLRELGAWDASEGVEQDNGGSTAAGAAASATAAAASQARYSRPT